MIAPCMRCGNFWASNAGPSENFSIISKLCPNCVAKLPTVQYGLVRAC